MKKILFIIILLIPFITYAEECNLEIKDIQIKDNKNVIENNKPVLNCTNIDLDLTMNTVGDYIIYQIDISNNTNDNYEIEKLINDDNIEYTILSDTNIIANRVNTIELKVEYKKEFETYTNGKYEHKKTLTTNFNKMDNPNTKDHIILIVFILVISIVLFMILKNIKVPKYLILIILLIPIVIYATNKETITINSKINVIPKTLLINSINTKPELSTDIDYSTGEGIGIYTLSGTENNTNPIYFYRGNINNNNVIFANFCWKIVRTTELGGIKLVYNGEPNNNTCNNTLEATEITKDKYSLFNKDNTYVGYKYGTPEAESYEEAHSNMNDSNIKTIIDEWYTNNLIGYSNYLEDSIWCNDRSIAPDSPGEGYGTNATNYNGRYRLNINKTPSVVCNNDKDKFTVSKEIGNGELTYPIALLTADEVALAGAVWNIETDYYLKTGSPQWTMTPSRLNSVYPSVFVIQENGSLWAHSGNLDGIRPSIVLKSNIKYKEGTKGTADNPYIVE